MNVVDGPIIMNEAYEGNIGTNKSSYTSNQTYYAYVSSIGN